MKRTINAIYFRDNLSADIQKAFQDLGITDVTVSHTDNRIVFKTGEAKRKVEVPSSLRRGQWEYSDVVDRVRATELKVREIIRDILESNGVEPLFIHEDSKRIREEMAAIVGRLDTFTGLDVDGANDYLLKAVRLEEYMKDPANRVLEIDRQQKALNVLLNVLSGYITMK